MFSLRIAVACDDEVVDLGGDESEAVGVVLVVQALVLGRLRVAELAWSGKRGDGDSRREQLGEDRTEI